MIKYNYDVGLVTMWYGINYGSILTGTALYKVISELGYKTLMINKPKELWLDLFYDKDTIANMFCKKFFIPSRIREFYPEHYELNQICDQFVVGCDTLWHYPIIKNAYKFFFLDFVHSEKNKISYASSFGAGLNAPDLIKKNIGFLLNKFNYISVREASAVNFIDTEFKLKATQVIDPVFLLDKAIYNSFTDKVTNLKLDSDYIFAYILDTSEEKLKYLDLIAQKKQLKVCLVLDPMNYGKIKQNLEEKIQKYKNILIQNKITVEEWLYLIKHASICITDSFHGLCFSLIFNKDFICLLNKARGAERFRSLLGLIDSQSNLIDISLETNEDKLLQSTIEQFTKTKWDLINSTFNKYKETSLDWLKKALKNQDMKMTSPINEFKDMRARIETLELIISKNILTK